MPTILLNNIRPGGKTLTNLKVGSTEVKYVKRGDGKLFYDILSYYSYGTPSVSLSYPTGNTSAAGGTKSPTISYTLSKTPVGYSGTTYTASTLSSGATIKYTLNSTTNGASINATTGVVTWGANTTTSTRSVTVTATVTLNGNSGTKTYTLTLNADSVSSSTITLTSSAYTSSSSACAYSGGTCTITGKVTRNWVSGNITYAKPTLTSSNAGFTIGSLNTNYQATGTWAKSTSTSVRSSTITASYSGATSKTVTVYQAANTSTTTEYEAPVIESVTAKDIIAGGGTTDNSYYTVKFYQRKRTVYADGTTSAWSYAYASDTTAATNNITASKTITGSNLGTTVKSRTSLGTVNITITYNGKTSAAKSVTVYQAANSTFSTYSSLTVTSFSYATFPYLETATKSPTITVTVKLTTRYTSGSEGATVTNTITNYSKNFSISSTTYFTIVASTGAVTTKSANDTSTARTATVTVSVSYEGLTTSKTATVTLPVGGYSVPFKFSVFNVTTTIYSFGFKFYSSTDGLYATVTGGGGSSGTTNPSREGTISIGSIAAQYKPNSYYFTLSSGKYQTASNSSGAYMDGSATYYVRWSYGVAPTTSNYKTAGYVFYNSAVLYWLYASTKTLYIWVYQI